MSGPEQALEAGIFALLASDGTIRSHLGDPPRLFAEVEGLPAYPFLELAAHDGRPAGSDGAPASEHRIDIAVVVRSDAAEGLRELVAHVRDRLDGARPVLGGWRCVLLTVVFTDIMSGRRGRERRGLLRLKAIVEPVGA